MTFSIQTKLAHVSVEQREKIQNELDRLTIHLKEKYNLDGPRDDSRLAYYWASGEGDKPMTMEEVASQIHLMHRLYNDTDYAWVCETVVDKIVSDLQYRHGVERTTANILVTRHIVPGVKALYQQVEQLQSKNSETQSNEEK